MPSLPHGDYLAFDYGTVRIGIATGHSQIGTTTPLSVVKNNSGTPLWQDIDKLISEWVPVGLVLGLPLTLDGETQEITHHAKGFGKMLRKRYELPLFMADERFSSMLAQQEMQKMRARAQRGKTQKEDIDKLAAALILEQWLASTDFVPE